VDRDLERFPADFVGFSGDVFFFVGFRWDYLGLQLRWLWNQAEHQQQWKSFTILDYIWYLLLISSTWNHVKPALVDYTTNKNVDVTSWLLWMGIESDMTGVDLNSNVLWYDVSFKTCSNHRNISRRYDHYTDKEKTLHIMSYQVLSNHDMIYAMLKKHQKPVSSKSILYPICSMVLVYLPTWLGDFGQGQMLGFIFQHHGSHMGYTKKHKRRCVVLPASRTAMAAQNCESGRSSKSARHGGFFCWYLEHLRTIKTRVWEGSWIMMYDFPIMGRSTHKSINITSTFVLLNCFKL